MWYKLSKDEKEKHIHVMRVYLLSPFLFGQVYQDDKVGIQCLIDTLHKWCRNLNNNTYVHP